jgi:ABC-2 type transport system ATP-binding protein
VLKVGSAAVIAARVRDTHFESEDMIKVENLRKTFGPKVAVNDVSFSVERGEVLGFLGPNGAGKSTTMRMITGFIPPDAGRIRVGGHDVVEEPLPAKRLIGYLPENAPSYSDMTVRGFLGFAAEVRGLRGAAKRGAVERVVEMCFLDSVVNQSVDTLSKGYKHRTCLAQALLHDPAVLIMDEPTDGLDPNQKYEVRSLIKRMSQNKAIVFSTHILEEVESVCTRAIIIDRGQIVANGTPEELKARSELAGAVTLSVENANAQAIAEQLARLAQVKQTLRIGIPGGRDAVRAFPRSGEASALALAVAELARAQGWRVNELRVEEGRLDEVFRTITKPDTAKRTSAEARA